MIADGNAEAVDNLAGACVRVNSGDCGGSGVPNQGSGPTTQVVPVVTGDATATADDLADAAACLRINGGDCGDNDPGSDGTGGTDNTTVARLVGGLGDPNAGADISVDSSVPTLSSDDTATARGVLGICLRINGGSCAGEDSGGSGDGGTGGPLGRTSGGRRRVAGALDPAGTAPSAAGTSSHSMPPTRWPSLLAFSAPATGLDTINGVGATRAWRPAD